MGETVLLTTNEPLFEIGETTVIIASDGDIVTARQQSRALVLRCGFASTDATLVATAVSELARNIVQYAKQGEIILKPVEDQGRRGLLVIARDDGPGIPDVERAIGGGCSTSGSLGLGLRGVKRLMDEFEIVSVAGSGTTVRVKKWSGPRVSVNSSHPASTLL
jgi:serine/threonine-protein kinase RsbT